jgi:hypothetical protein
MPIEFDEYTESDELGNWLRPDSNSYVILSFLAKHPKQGFTPHFQYPLLSLRSFSV